MNFFKLIGVFLLFSMLGFNAYSQTTCASEINLPLIQQNNPARYQRIMALEQHTQNYINSVNNGTNNARLIQPNSTIIIPVVVHILHRGEQVGTGRNISDAQILSQIDVLNEDFRRLNADRINTPSAFQPVAGDPNFEFRLACIDPNGNPTNGITRTFAGVNQFQPLSSLNTDDGSINELAARIKFTAQGGRDAWPTDRYLNIWVCDMGGGLIGYGQFPFDYSVKPNTDGVVMLFNAFGRVGTLQAGLNQGRVCVHEIGHWLNLRHIWGDAYCGNDFVDDTPPQAAPNRGCPGFPNVTCNNGPNGDMFMNYMDYTNNGCQNIYTRGQSLRARAVFAQGGPRAAFINNYFRINENSANVACVNNTITIAAINPLCLPITWSISGAAIIISGQGTNMVTLQGQYAGTAIVTATAGGYTDSKTITVGAPNVNFNVVPYYSGQTYCARSDGNLFRIDPVNIPDVPFYQWGYITNPNGSANTIVVNEFGSEQQDFTFTETGDIEIFARPGNACGLGGIQILPIRITICGGFENFASLSPNPTNGDINISTKNKANSIKAIRIIDKSGNLKRVFRNTVNGHSQKINISDLRADIYFIQVFDGIKWWSKKIIKN
ncbi:MAG: T9SS type A sorting domain-containing protein [Hydrotalea sp. AMD]|uniref:M43 family zinc metalloprotease n=1 Tax=Hydrotalea sp. AMD TaxID=2501297 RepID=UPI000A65067B|nr:M43 family zinc metalloprotease [Hydrotalea sp. AMD]RTL55486.1 MAG: T9SS type A sorting domain-containing protein [Sphingobacteriales bacterium]RWZ88132.1 MAG: T9SS type A sorting domain-containing protein [Hydrotalea sp. AMD]